MSQEFLFIYIYFLLHNQAYTFFLKILQHENIYFFSTSLSFTFSLPWSIRNVMRISIKWSEKNMVSRFLYKKSHTQTRFFFLLPFVTNKILDLKEPDSLAFVTVQVLCNNQQDESTQRKKYEIIRYNTDYYIKNFSENTTKLLKWFHTRKKETKIFEGPDGKKFKRILSVSKNLKTTCTIQCLANNKNW